MYPADIVETLPGPDWLRAQRAAAARRAAEAPMPTFELEEWRYSPIDQLRLEDFAPTATPPVDVDVVGAHVEGAVASVVTVDGFVTSVDLADGPVRGLRIGSASDGASDDVGEIDLSGVVDVFGEVNTAFAPDPIVISVDAGADIAGPVVVTHHVRAEGVAAFPRVHVEVGADASLSVVEVMQSADVSALVAPVTRLSAAPASRLRYQVVQELGPRIWQLGSLVADADNQATLIAGVAAMGAGYGRLRTDCRLVGRGATGDLLAVYFGDGDQTLDFRTFQDHRARDTTSNLLFKGVLDGSSTSIYTGLIRVAPEAAGTNAFQTNRNIKLSDDAWAESVPNLEIENNDVRCSHASTVSPVDAEQRFYLESRGVPTPVAERLIVEGFLDEVIESLPVPEIAAHVEALVQAKLARRQP